MKFYFSVVASILCVVLTILAIHADQETLAVVSRIFFKLFLFLSFFYAGKIRFTATFISFLSLIFLADILAIFAFNLHDFFGYWVAATIFFVYLLLFKDAWAHFKMNRINYTAWNFVAMLILNGVVIAVNLKSIFTDLNSSIVVVIGQILYNLSLFAIVAISLAYYLNSYSTKAMLFLVANITFLCSDLMYSAFYFYGVGDYILPFGVLLSTAAYIFIFKYFIVIEEPLLLESDILKEIQAMEQRKLKHQV